MRYLSRAVVFDAVLGMIAAVVAFTSSGWLRSIASFLLFMAIIWLPWDLFMERRRERQAGEPDRQVADG